MRVAVARWLAWICAVHALEASRTVGAVRDVAVNHGESSRHPSQRHRHRHRHRDLIVNGEIAEKGRYPYFVTLEHYCGGALIAPDVVLAAGHCYSKKYPHAKVGTFDFETDRVGKDFEYIKISRMVRHPAFVRLGDDEFVHDFLLIHLNDASNHTYLMLNSNGDVPQDRQEVTAMGVGNTDPDADDSISNVLRQVTLNAMDSDVCERSSDAARDATYQDHIHSSHLCTTGGRNNKRDSCAYDSGSPIIIPGPSAEHDLLVGLVSWGMECADPYFPAVNARVSDAYDWIRANVCAMSVAPPDYLCAATPEEKAIHWMYSSWKMLASLLLGVVIGLSIAGHTLRGQRLIRKTTWPSFDSTVDELVDLKSCSSNHPSRAKLSSYDSMEDGVELEPCPLGNSGDTNIQA